MADIVENVMQQAAENLTETTTSSGKPPATLEGTAVAYGSLVVMAMLPIFLGSVRSLNKSSSQSKDRTERMNTKDAMMFPLIASVSLFGLYLFFKIFSRDYINLLLTGYFFCLGVLALSNLMSPVINVLVPTSIPNIPFQLQFTEGEGNHRKDIINYKFTSYDVACLFMSTLVGIWYSLQKHWIANNLFGVAFAVNAVALLRLNNVITGCILLSGLFVYDIFWVFGTNVMVTVAKSFEAPIKLVFPQDLLTNGLSASNFAMLGLGDIVIPGIFIALLLRFDMSLKRKSRLYFYATFVAYFLGLMTTIFVMHVFKHAQPALLYLVPACIGTPVAVALVKGDIKTMFAYDDNPQEKEGKTEKKGSSSSGGKKEAKKTK
ncbi:minor histocompatibility antigen H13 [Phlebotomus argentipes]|uniref:minor histocompatibility antigen H13 n=1 Tax=Phlebotomus argentipes TaxID=94469 RepID=UPI002892D46C|nr:minor histocompatibility antigen H13 [Phlebotomus argentipes]